MSRLKTFLKYVIWIVLFYIFSNILIFVGLNNTYKPMAAMQTEIDSRIEIKRAQSTLVNGRIRGTVTNEENNDLSGKYLKISIYADNEMLMGTKYIQISNLKPGESQDFETYYKFEHTKYFDISIVDEIGEQVGTEAFSTEEISQAFLALLLVRLCLKI